jgi:hypothetical protein
VQSTIGSLVRSLTRIAPSPSDVPLALSQKQEFKDEEQKNKSHSKVDGFAASYGTVVFFEDKGAPRSSPCGRQAGGTAC